METSLTFTTWKGLLVLALWLLVFYFGLMVINYLVERLGRKTLTNRTISNSLNKALLLYKPIAVLVLLLGFISVNYITHTILLLVIGASAFKQIRNYVFGIFFKMNPLLQKGATLQFRNKEGELKKFLPFGAILSTEKGEYYFTYEMLDRAGFLVKLNTESALRQTLYIDATKRKD